ncbi:MAG: TraB/GumN family protein [Xanthomonadales bacterium]|nr:TraB/GumN family protein [Xanthomonadales bacterium]
MGSFLVSFALLLAPLGAPSSARAGAEHDVFWSIHDEAGHAGYLLGTVHSEDPRVLEFTETFLGSLRGCEGFAMELVPDLPTMRRLLAYMELPEGESLDTLLGPERFEAVKAAVAGYAVPEDRLRRMKPWAAMMTLSLPPPKTGLYLDFSLSLRAAGFGARVTGLETLEEQLSFLERMSPEDQLRMLDQALADHDRVQVVHDELVTTYLEGDLDALEAMARAEMAVLPEATRTWFQAEGIDARNRRMVSNALPRLEEGCLFIAVGALHLPGDQGLLTLLQEAGYRLEPEPSPFCSVRAPDRQAADPAVTARVEAGCP